MTSSSGPTAADKIREDAAAAHARIRANTDLSHPAMQRKMAAVHVAAQSTMDTAQKSAAAWAQRDTAAAQNAVWGIDDIPGATVNRAQVSMSYRDAQDRAELLDQPQEAAALLDRANSTGDELLARAVAFRAYTMATGPIPAPAWADVLDNYLANRPQAKTAVDRLIAARQPLNAAALFGYMLMPPSELAGMNPTQIAQLAAQDKQPA